MPVAKLDDRNLPCYAVVAGKGASGELPVVSHDEAVVIKHC